MFNNKAFSDCIITPIEHTGAVTNGGNLILINASKDKGFNWPYLLFIPKEVNIDSTIIVEGANTADGSVNISNINEDKEKIKEAISSVKKLFIYSNNPIERINEETTNYPLLYPLFPRFHYHNKGIYNHMLASNSMFTNEEELKELGLYRSDLQLMNMITDAQNRLSQLGLKIDDKIIITGFSASSKFANRFTLLHPEIVKYTIAGGLGGTITLPLRELNKELLLWPIGIGNVSEINDDKLELYKKVPQFYYMGLQDSNDSYEPNNEGTNKYEDILQPNEAKQLYRLIGKNMTGNRWENTQKIINALNYNIIFKSYQGGHNPNIANNEVKEIFLNFVKSNILK